VEVGSMNVAVDVTPVAQTRAGTARYLNALLPRVERDVEVDRLRGFAQGRPGTLWLDLAWYPHVLPHRARAADVLHCPTYRGPVRTSTPLVVTVHDVAVFRHPEAFPRWTRAYSRFAVPRVLRAARRVLAVSEFTASELGAVLGVPREKIAVTPNAVDDVFTPHGPASDGDYVLAVGTLEPRKNLARTIEATARLGLELRVVGARGWGDVDVSGSRVTLLGEVSDEELARQYRGALCVAYPSLYEGFGIPVLEAMACGVPVATSAGGATEEIAGGAAVLVDPIDVAAIAGGIEEAIRRRDELRVLGLERAGAFSWDETARLTVAAYREAAA
jgi:glycosyltransferase involved in cell wall biosynthesis